MSTTLLAFANVALIVFVAGAMFGAWRAYRNAVRLVEVIIARSIA